MENLTHQQIEEVIHLMETWEQLKDTAIPIRFKEDFTKHRSSIGIATNEKVLLPLFFTMAYNTVLVGEANS